ncbi:MAG TPA: ATP-binding protein, partial [Ramlibacter sp.]|nr:ATP-binding protein [Ramlibacter sp.]
VIRNLLVNAIESACTSEAGRVTVAGRAGRGAVVFEVDDSGPGVDPRMLPTLFDAAPSSKAGGLGVGLSICRAIIEAHGGRLWAEPGPGGHFFFTLPTDDHVPGAS